MKPKLISILFIALLIGCGGGSSSGTTPPLDPDENTTEDTTPPTFISSNHFLIAENHIYIGRIKATDDTSSVRYYLSGGDDKGLFYIYRYSGVLIFKSNPDYEQHMDHDGNNIFELTIEAKDRNDNIAYQDVNITLLDIDNEDNVGDSDSDFIPDNIENIIESNSSNSDQDNNGELDGLQISGDISDEFYQYQWHLRDYEERYTNESGVLTQGEEGISDLNVTDIYHKYMGFNEGNPIIVQVVDTGVDTDHEDLIDNINLSLSYNGEDYGIPKPNHTHGTMVAGIIASRGFNKIGVRGIAPFANIAGSNWLRYQSAEGISNAWTNDNDIAITNNSWGAYQESDTMYEDLMQYGAEHLRDGKGRIYVFAAGNDRDDNGNANLSYMLNNRFPVVVAALQNDNTYASYSSPGANILVSGYSGDYYQNSNTIGTTTIAGDSSNSGDINSQTTWDEDTKENYTFIMNGTSAATPTVAGSLALVLEACPDLGWRDVRYLIAKTAVKIDSANASWITNASNMHYSIDYGFGKINAQGMIAKCTNGYTNLSAEQNLSITKDFNILVDDEDSQTFDINVTDNIKVEWVEVTIDNDNSRSSDYDIYLKSPQGTTVMLMVHGSNSVTDWMNGGWRFSTPAMLDEDSNGTWKVKLDDKVSGNSGTVKSIQIKIYGH